MTFLSVATTGVSAAALPLVVNVLVFSTAFGLATGGALVKWLGVGYPVGPILAACFGFRNIGNLPMVIIPSACRLSVFAARFGGSVEACAVQGDAYIAINVSAISIVQFSVVHRLFRPAAADDDQSSRNKADERDAGDDWRSWLRHLLRRGIRCGLSVPPPALAALAGGLVAMSPLKPLVTESFVSDAASILARATVGATVPLLGSTLYNESRASPPRDPSGHLDDDDHDGHLDGEQGRRGSPQPLSAALLAKLVPLQLIAMPWASSAVFLFVMWLVDLARGTTSDPLMLLTAVVSSSTPPAIILLSLAIIHGVPPKAMAQLLLVLYVAAAAALPLNVVLYTRIIAAVFV